ncbi:MAG: glycosyltransferase [Oscillospiraceae bacterium]|nr:glycosyltransferase [Oscillospiraceae bacterium]
MESETRVLHVINSMNLGGAETLIMDYFRRMPPNIRFDFLVHVLDKMYYEEEIGALGGRVHRMDKLQTQGIPAYFKCLRTFFATEGYHIVHSHLETTTGLILAAAKSAGVPVRIAQSHNTRYTRKGIKALPENTVKKTLRLLINPAATIKLAPNAASAKWLYGHAAYTLFPNTIDTAKFAFSAEARTALREKFGIGSSCKVFLNIARFSPQKNHAFLLETWRQYTFSHPEDMLFLAGAGELIEKMKALKVPNAVFLGLQSDIPALLSMADVFLLPSLFEGFPVSLAEAAAAGLPCLISDTIDGGSLPCRKLPLVYDAWFTAMAERNPVSVAERENAALKTAEQGYDISYSVSKLKEIYAQA